MGTNVNVLIRITVWLERIIVWPVMVYRYCKFGYTFRRIYLGEGMWTILDQPDYYRLRHFKWVLYGGGHNWYAARLKIAGPYKTRTISMHREIMNANDERFVDHRNCESLDNRMDNLRFATHTENVHNRRKQKNTTSQFIGVSFYKPTNNWESRIQHGEKRIRLGRFDSEIAAAKAYDEAAKRLFGEFARLNFPPENEESRALFARIGKLIRPKTPDLRRKTADSV